MPSISTHDYPETGQARFLLPGVRLAVILACRYSNPDLRITDVLTSDIIISNVRVLAIHQTVEEKNGQKVVVGKTATLELKPEQSEILARSRQSGVLSLALRSLVDAGQMPNDDSRMRRDPINIVRYGVQK